MAKIDPTGADPKNPDAVNAVIAAKTFESMSDLQFPTEDRYALNQGGALIEGSVTREAGRVTLTPETVNGMEAEKARAGGASVHAEADSPVELELSEDGHVLAMPPGPHGEKLTFVRFQAQVGPDVTTADEKALVGRWTVARMEGISAGQEGGGFDYLLKRTALNLQRDHKFQMRFVYRIEGTWKLEGDRIRLTYPSGKLALTRSGANFILTSPDGKVRLFLAH